MNINQLNTLIQIELFIINSTIYFLAYSLCIFIFFASISLFQALCCLMVSVCVLLFNANKIIIIKPKYMRQNMQERQKQIRRLHESIQKYQQSPTTKKAVEHATTQLLKAIEYKYNKSQINAHYRFPKNTQTTDSDDDDLGFSEIVDLKLQNDFLSQQLSVAEQAESNFVYVSQKMILMTDKDKGDGFTKRKIMDKPDNKSRLKIKVIKKKNQQNTLQTTQKLDRLKTQHINTNFSTQSYKNELRTSANEHSASKSRLLYPLTDITRLRQKLKIASRLQSDSSPHPNITIKTQYSYTNCTKRKSGKENQRLTLNPHTSVSVHEKEKDKEKERYYFGQSHTTHKKIDMSNHRLHQHVGVNVGSAKNLLRKHINTSNHFSNLSNNISTCNLKSFKQSNDCFGTDILIENTPKTNILNNKSKKLCHKSFESLKSIRLGNKSSQKFKAKGLHA